MKFLLQPANKEALPSVSTCIRESVGATSGASKILAWQMSLLLQLHTHTIRVRPWPPLTPKQESNNARCFSCIKHMRRFSGAWKCGNFRCDPSRNSVTVAQLAFWLLAATDGHAKNFSVFLNAGDTYRLTPLYDVLSAWPVIGHGANSLSPQKARLAMGLRAGNMPYRLREIRARHYREVAEKSGVPTVWDKMQALIDKVPPSLAAVEKRLVPDFPRLLWERISHGMLSQAGVFKDETLDSGLV